MECIHPPHSDSDPREGLPGQENPLPAEQLAVMSPAPSEANLLSNAMAQIGERPDFNQFPLAFESIIRKTIYSTKLPLDRDELHHVGVIGLLAAYEKYDPSRGMSFESFATHCIRRHVLDFARQELPISHREYRRIKHARELSDQGKSNAEIAAELAISEKGLGEMRHRYHRMGSVLSTDWRASGVSGAVTDLIAGVEEVGYSTVENELVKDGHNPRSLLMQAIQIAPSRAGRPRGIYAPENGRDMFMSHYFDDTPMKSIAQTQGITVSAVSRACRRIITQITTYIATADEDERLRWLTVLGTDE